VDFSSYYLLNFYTKNEETTGILAIIIIKKHNTLLGKKNHYIIDVSAEKAVGIKHGQKEVKSKQRINWVSQ